jgi:hypothetical protein
MLEAYNAAKEGAFDLFSYCSSVFPSEWQEDLPDIVRKRAIEFALHARRAHEISGVDYKAISDITGFRMKMSGIEKIHIEKGYGETLNMLIHSRFLLLATVQRGESLEKIFLSSASEYNLAFMIAETDRKSRRHLNLYGLATKFLVEAAPKIKNEIQKKSVMASGT